MTRTMYGPVALATPTPATGDANALAFAVDPLPVSRTRGGTLEVDIRTVAGTITNPVAGGTFTTSGNVDPDPTTGAAAWFGPDGYVGTMWIQDPDTSTWWPVLPSDIAGLVAPPPTWTSLEAAVDFPDYIAAGDTQLEARAAIGAGSGDGTSNLTLGTTSSTAKAGDWKPTAADITDATATGRNVLKATDQPAARAAIGAVATGDLPGFASDFAVQAAGGDVPTWDAGSGLLTPQAPVIPQADPLILRGATLNPGQPIPPSWPAGGIAFIRQTAVALGATAVGANGIGTSAATLAATLTDAIGVGEDLLVTVVAASPGTLLSSITVADASTGGGAPNTYVQRGQRLQGATVQVQVYKCRPVTALAAATDVTVTFGAAVGAIAMTLTKMTGLQAPSTDQVGQNGAATTDRVTIATGGLTAQPNELATLSLGFSASGNTVVDPELWAERDWSQVGATQSSGGSNPKFSAVFVRTLTAAEIVSVTPQVSSLAGSIIGAIVTHKAA